MSDRPLEGESGYPEQNLGADPDLEGSPSLEPVLPEPSRDASAALMLGILGFASCGLVSPLALYYSWRALQELEASGGSYSGERNARLGQLMGLIGTALLLMGIVLLLLFAGGAWDFVSDLEL